MSDGDYKIRNKEGVHFITFVPIHRDRMGGPDTSGLLEKNTEI